MVSSHENLRHRREKECTLLFVLLTARFSNRSFDQELLLLEFILIAKWSAMERSSKVVARLRVEVAIKLVRSLAVREVLREQSITLRLTASCIVAAAEVLREVGLLAKGETGLTHHLTHSALCEWPSLAVAAAELLTVTITALRRSSRHLSHVS